MYLEILDRLDLVSGKYIFFPNKNNPYMIVPYYDFDVFRKALSIIKNNSLKFEMFKYLAIYFDICKFIKKTKFFEIYEINNNKGNGNFHRIIFPSLVDKNKVTLISFNETDILVEKYYFYGSSKLNFNPVKREFNILSKIKSQYIPQIKSYIENENYSRLTMNYFEGVYSKKLKEEVVYFFNSLKKDKLLLLEEHYFYQNLIFYFQKSNIKDKYFHKLVNRVRKKIENNKILLSESLMHGDFSKTNFLLKKNDFLIIDWEYAEDKGLPIDISYFYFRMNIDNNKKFFIKNLYDGISVLYYLYFNLKYHDFWKRQKNFFEKINYLVGI